MVDVFLVIFCPLTDVQFEKFQHDADVWPAWSGKEEEFHSTKLRLLSLLSTWFSFAPLTSGLQALKGLNIAKGYQRWGTVGCWGTTRLCYSKGKKKKRSIGRAVLTPYRKPLLVLVDRRVLGACEANDLMKVKALWWPTCDVNNVL